MVIRDSLFFQFDHQLTVNILFDHGLLNFNYKQTTSYVHFKTDQLLSINAQNGKTVTCIMYNFSSLISTPCTLQSGKFASK